MELNLDRVLAISGIILAILLVVLDKAGKMRGPWLLAWLGVCACLSLPLIFSIPWVADAPSGIPIFARRCLVFFVVAGLWAALSVWITTGDPEEVRPKQPLPAEPSQTAAEEISLAEIDRFLLQKDEVSLRETFDYPSMLKYNILFAKGKLFPNTFTVQEKTEMDTFFKGGQAILDIRYAHVVNDKNRARVDWIPGQLGLVNISSKYSESRRHLIALYSSSQIPDSVCSALRDFDNTIQLNTRLMIESLNQSAKTPQSIIQNDVYGSQWYGTASGLYWVKFSPLEPKAQEVRTAIVKYKESMQHQP